MSGAVAHDEATLAFYAREAEAYAAATNGCVADWLDRFAGQLPLLGEVLELGCGGGSSAAALLARGFSVRATDGSPEMAARAARRLGRPVDVLRFDELTDQDRYAGILANACLLHVPQPALPSILARIHAALKPGGVFYASFKTGRAPGRDRLGRYYNYPTEDELRAAMTGAGKWRQMKFAASRGTGYEGSPAEWLHVLASKA